MLKNKKKLLGYFTLTCGLIVCCTFISGVYIGEGNEVLKFLIGGLILVELGIDELQSSEKNTLFENKTLSNKDLKYTNLYYCINSGAFTIMKWILFLIVFILISSSFIFKLHNNSLLIVSITLSSVWFGMNLLSKLVYFYYKNKI